MILLLSHIVLCFKINTYIRKSTTHKFCKSDQCLHEKEIIQITAMENIFLLMHKELLLFQHLEFHHTFLGENASEML